MSFRLYLLCRRFEALVASQLDPEAFGAYMATGTMRQTYGEVLFTEINPAMIEDSFDLERARRECVPHEDGSPRRSKYVSIYRVLERIPMRAFGHFNMVTRDGRVLCLEPRQTNPEWEKPDGVNMYMELCPTVPLVVSRLGPASFVKAFTNPENAVSVPRILIADMLLDQESDGRLASYLPYRHPAHIHQCIREVTEAGKASKVVDRNPTMTGFFRTIRRGFFLGDQGSVIYYRFPSIPELEDEYHPWWRSASLG